MPIRLASLVSRQPQSTQRSQPSPSAEPIQVTARNSWHRQASVAGHGFCVQALRCGEHQLPGRIQVKPIPLVGVGAGVLHPGDADVDEAHDACGAVLRIEFERPSLVQNLDLGLLFDGPEYADWEEAARFDVSFAGDATPRRFTLYTSFVDAGFASCSWDGSAVPWTSSGAWGGGPGLWLNTDPFGGRAVTRLDLHAAHATDAHGDPLAPQTRHSDYVFRSLEALECPDADALARLTDEIGRGSPSRVRA
jgi:hypothetical protein